MAIIFTRKLHAMFKYNRDGYLRPYKANETTLEEFKEEFLWNDHRKMLFEKFESFIDKVRKIDPLPFYVWLNGSFVSKKETPGDIDFVVFVEYSRVKFIEERLIQLKYDYGFWLDAYFVADFPEGHKFHNLTIWQKNEYFELFTTTRVHPVKGFKIPKGFVQLNYF